MEQGLWKIEEGSIEGRRVVFLGEQGTEEWNLIRKYRVTGSIIAAVRGKSKFKTTKQTLDVILGKTKEEINENMLHGKEKEQEVREWYEKTHSVKIQEVGFAYLENFPYIGVSPDGLISSDGLIEIKCPKDMYPPLRDRTNSKETRWKEYVKRGPKDLSGGPVAGDYKCKYPEHIYTSHYDQMQAQMAVFGRKWCDYVVVSYNENMVFQQRVEFNPEYWRMLKAEINDFVDKYLRDYPCYIPKIKD
jgi:hypothetical protein